MKPLVTQRFVLIFSLILVVQLFMPWHVLHLQALAADPSAPAENPVSVASGSGCHGPAAVDSGDDASMVAGFCEWLCAQGQTVPLWDGLVAVSMPPRDSLLSLWSGSDKLPDAVPTPPPIA